MLAGLLAVSLIGLSACDSNGGGGDVIVEGQYRFTQLRFDVSAAAVADAEVLDSLVASSTYLQFFSDGNVILPYQFSGEGSSGVYSGNYTANGGEVTIDFNTTPVRLLMPREITLEIEGDGSVLSAEESLNMDLSGFSDAYPAGDRFAGTLMVRLERGGGAQ